MFQLWPAGLVSDDEVALRFIYSRFARHKKAGQRDKQNERRDKRLRPGLKGMGFRVSVKIGPELWLSRSLAMMMAVGALAGPTTLSAQNWTVKPEWVRSHESFLASDALGGRGSATRDEEIAAEYVASEFAGYGLKTAPGMLGYMQSAEVVAPELDGHATLSAGQIILREGEELQLLASSGQDASGPLRRVSGEKASLAGLKPGAVVLLTGEGSGLMATLREARASKPGLIVLRGDDNTRKLMEQMGGRTRVRMRLEEDRDGASASMVVLSAGAFGQIAGLSEGSVVTLGVHALPQSQPRLTYNAIGYLPGSDPGSGTILLTAHLDHLGMGAPVNGDPIYNGANDDAAGTTAVMELAHALAAGPKLRRNVLFVCYGSEEAGELGSEHFGRHTPVELKDLVTNLEFEMIGNQDPKMPKGTLLLTGWERSNLGPTLKEHGAKLGPDPYPEQHFFERSDNYQLALRGVVAHTAAGWGTPPTYHQPSDDLNHLDVEFMTEAIQSLIEPVRWLASSDFRPAWNPGQQPKR